MVSSVRHASRPAKGSVGIDSGFKLMRGPHEPVGMSLFKKVPFGAEEKRYTHLRLDAFNAFNSTEWNTFNWSIQS